MPGADSLEAAARGALLDALEALGAHRDAIVLIGAQAIYIHTGDAPVALAPFTKDADLAIDVRSLRDDPRIERAMTSAGFVLDPVAKQPGTWLSPGGIPVDLMVPDSLSQRGGRRGGRIPPHASNATRRAVGLEGAVVDNRMVRIEALDPSDGRAFEVNVAGPAALLVSKLHKIWERRDDPRRLVDKDAHDVYRLLVACQTRELAAALGRLRVDDLAGAVTVRAIDFLAELFAASGDALGAVMAGRAETGVGSPGIVAASSAALATELRSGRVALSGGQTRPQSEDLGSGDGASPPRARSSQTQEVLPGASVQVRGRRARVVAGVRRLLREQGCQRDVRLAGVGEPQEVITVGADVDRCAPIDPFHVEQSRPSGGKDPSADGEAVVLAYRALECASCNRLGRRLRRFRNGDLHRGKSTGGIDGGIQPLSTGRSGGIETAREPA